MNSRGWAIVTGASGGLGAAFTKTLARRNYSVLAVARSVEPLKKLAEEIRNDGGVVETLAADLATPEGLNTVIRKAHALGDIELLVNNAGLSTSGDFLAQSADREIQSIRVNVEALYTLTRNIVPAMVERKRGRILNVASVVGFQAIPYWTTYAATKAFVLSFGEGLAHELRHTGVRVVTVCPGFTKTSLYAESGVPGLAGRLLPHAEPDEVVRAALAACDRGQVICVIGWANRLLTLAGAVTPRFLLRRIMASMFAPSAVL
jgi:short-subunit dehydrogenase